jgi:uncharacterized protein (DUF1501 family)
MNRRQFLQHTGFATASTLAAVGTHGWVARSFAKDSVSNQSAQSKRLIAIFLRGAVDGLNVVVPYRETAYYQNRPRIAIPQPSQAGGALDLDGQFGLHPALADLMPLWQQKSLAFIHAAGSPDPTRSHFEAQDKMERGILDSSADTQDGWMNRLLGIMSGRNPIQAVNVGNTTPRILAGRIPVATLATGRGATRPLPLDRPSVAAAFDNLYGNSDSLGQAYKEGRLARTALLSNLDAETKMANNGAPLPNGFASDARRLAQIMVKDSRVKLGFMALGGWDTHVNQGASQGQLARNLAQVGKGLAALQMALGPTYKDTTVLVMSEFGRTARENGDGGTDHGHGNIMGVMGGAVKGGKVYGDWTGLSPEQLHENRDLAITTDFRDAIAAILERHLLLSDAQLDRVLPNYRPLQKNLPLYT